MEFRGIFVDLRWRRSGYSPNQLKCSKLQIHSLYVSLTPKTELAQHKPYGGGRSLLQPFTVKRDLSEGYVKDSVRGNELR
ncbi:hypothetical protein F2Q68_00017529 [Brassica cretica]|uniref:Uncharacterized protein n=1 Tax=Brassica cretica TaxID=69181 RepID=A0A8S9HLG1_BRACR|nr:hypothetical protein F2Q68_00017529 [Brassica cretica]